MYLDNDSYDLFFISGHNRFKVDILIAKTIQNLNKKGYKTLFSCSGHPSKDQPMQLHAIDTGEILEGYSIKNQIYISFAKDTFLPNIPKDFTYTMVNGNMQLEYIVPCNEDYKNEDSIRGRRERLQILKKILEKNKELYIWSENLEPNLVESMVR